MSDTGSAFFDAYEAHANTRSDEERLADQLSHFLPILASCEVTMANWPIFSDEYAVAQCISEAVVDAMVSDGHDPDRIARFLRSVADVPSTMTRIDLETNQRISIHDD